MSEDARFEDGREGPLNLGALDAEDLQVIAALAQDAVVPASEMSFLKRDRRFAMLINRFRWEDQGLERHGAERVQSILVFENVLKVASQGVLRDPNMVLSLLSVDFIPDAEPPGGQMLLTFAGDGALRLDVEALEVRLQDVTRPYRAPSGSVPHHEL